MRRCREAGLSVSVSQLDGNCFAFYVRLPGGWNGTRAIYHIHRGACAGDCEPNCDGYNDSAAALVLLVGQWAQSAQGCIAPTFSRRPLDEVIAEIAQGLHGAPRGRRSKKGKATL